MVKYRNGMVIKQQNARRQNIEKDQTGQCLADIALQTTHCVLTETERWKTDGHSNSYTNTGCHTPHRPGRCRLTIDVGIHPLDLDIKERS